MQVFFLIIIICCYTGTIVILSKQKFGECIPFTMLSMPLILYYTRFIFGNFVVGYSTILFIALICFPILLGTTKEKKDFIEKYFSIGFLGFIVIAAGLYVFDYGRYFHAWDELSHWGMMTKEMLRLNDWYSQETSRLLVHKEYPPFLTIFEVLVCKLYGKFSEPIVYWGIHIFILSLLVPPILERGRFENNENSKKYSFYYIVNNTFLCGIIAAIFMLAIESFDRERLLNSIYKDIPIAVIFSYAMLLIITRKVIEENFFFIVLLLASIALMLTKQMGILFLLLVWFYYGLNCVRNMRYKKDKKIVIIGKSSILVLIPMISHYIWKIYVNNLESFTQFSLEKISIKEFLNVIANKSENIVRVQTYNSFIRALLEKDIGSFRFPMTYISIFLVIMLIVGVLIKKASPVFGRFSIITMGVTFICGTVGYALTMLILYLFCYSEIEMLRLASFERYMPSYIIGEVLIIISILILIFAEKKSFTTTKLTILCGLMASCLTIYNLQTFIPAIFLERPNQEFIAIADKLESSIEGYARVFIVSESTLRSQYYTHYYLEDIDIPLSYDNVLSCDKTDKEMVESIEKLVFSYDYVYFQEISEDFNNCYSKLNGDNNFEADTLYKVLEDGSVSKVE